VVVILVTNEKQQQQQKVIDLTYENLGLLINLIAKVIGKKCLIMI